MVLVNHHLFFADLAMRTSRAGVEVLPPYEAVIFDEAHALEDVATEYFGLQVSSYRVEELSRDAQRAVADRPDLASMLKRTTLELAKAGERFFGSVARALAATSGRGPSRPAAAGAPRRRACAARSCRHMLEPLQGEQSGSTGRSRSCGPSWPTTPRRPCCRSRAGPPSSGSSWRRSPP